MEPVYDLDQLLDDMEDVYSEMPNEGAFLYLLPEQVREGLHCAVKLIDDSKWYRATVTGVEDNMVTFRFNVSSVIIPLI